MLSIQSPEVKGMIAGWQNELRKVTNDDRIRLLATKEPDVLFELEQLGEVVMHVTGIDHKRIVAPTRKREVVVARQLICYYARKVTKASYIEIGAYLGDRDHSTAMHAEATLRDVLASRNDYIIGLVEKVNIYLNEIKERGIGSN